MKVTVKGTPDELMLLFTSIVDVAQAGVKDEEKELKKHILLEKETIQQDIRQQFNI